MRVDVKHIAFIMDGNRRWARARKLPIAVGHTRGYQKIEKIVTYAKKLGIKHVTFWAFSTENWNRDKEEVDNLIKIFRRLLRKNAMKTIMDEGGRIVVLGDMTRFPDDIQKNVAGLIDATKDNSAITVNIALNYGGRAEILRAVNTLLQENQKEVNEEEFARYLYSAGQPDPDLIIRTGGEQRLSGYLPWQGVYSELYFTPTLWPDFDEKALDLALSDFVSRQRRFGK